MNDFSKRLLNPNDCGGDIGELDLAQPPLHLKWWDVLVRCKRTRETVFFLTQTLNGTGIFMGTCYMNGDFLRDGSIGQLVGI